VVNTEVTLFSLNLLQKSFLLFLNDLVILKQLGLEVNLLLVDAIGSVGLLLKESELLIWIRSANKRSGLLDDDEPSPVTESHVLSEVPLSNLDELSLVSLLSKLDVLDTLVDLSLEESEPFDDELVTVLLKLGKSSSSEEDKSVSKPISLSWELNLVHESISGGLVVR